MQDVGDSANVENASVASGALHVVQYDYLKTAAVAVGDYTLGGSIAGLAGSLGSQQRQMTLVGMRQPPGMSWLGWGFGTGMALGLVAGVCQAAVEIGSHCILEQERQQKENEVNETVAGESDAA